MITRFIKRKIYPSRWNGLEHHTRPWGQSVSYFRENHIDCFPHRVRLVSVIRTAATGLLTSLMIAGCVSGNTRIMTENIHTLEDDQAPTIVINHYPASPNCPPQTEPVLFVHGATFPGELSVGYKIDNQSWADDLNEACFDVWAPNFAGYGQSEAYTAFNRRIDTYEIPGRSHEVQQQLSRAAEFVQNQAEVEKMSIIAHSWGTIPAGEFAATNPGLIEKLVLFGAIGRREGLAAEVVLPPTQLITIESQHDRFVQDTPQNHSPVMDEAFLEDWGLLYLASDLHSGQRSPPSVEVPTGPLADIGAAWGGAFPYDPSQIQAATLLIRGEWDRLSTDEDNAWLRSSLSSAKKVTDIKLPAGGHLMHLETGRFDLREEVKMFLLGEPETED